MVTATKIKKALKKDKLRKYFKRWRTFHFNRQCRQSCPIAEYLVDEVVVPDPDFSKQQALCWDRAGSPPGDFLSVLVDTDTIEVWDVCIDTPPSIADFICEVDSGAKDDPQITGKQCLALL